MKFIEREFDGGVLFQVVQGDAGEIADDDIAGNLVVTASVLKPGCNPLLGPPPCAAACPGSCAQRSASLSKTGRCSPFAREILDRLFEAGDGAAPDAENLEELVPEGFGLGVLAETPAHSFEKATALWRISFQEIGIGKTLRRNRDIVEAFSQCLQIIAVARRFQLSPLASRFKPLSQDQ